MTPLETLLAFFVVMGIISIPIVSIIFRRSSLIGKAIADRIRKRGLPTLPAGTTESDLRAVVAQQQNILEEQQEEIRRLNEKVDFVQRLLEKPKE